MKQQRRPLSRHQTRLVSALVAGSACALGSMHAEAVQLGEIDVQSSLGQPLRASIAFALSPNEQIGDYCIYLRRAPAGTGLPALSDARLTVANGRIHIAGRAPVREPMLDIGLSINCPYTANLTRFYTVMLDPYEPASQQSTPVPSQQPTPVPTPAPVATAQPALPPAVAQRRSANTSSAPSVARAPQPPVAAQGEYLVKVGDSLSEIASRIEERPVGLWAAVDLLFAANPHAFIDGDINKLKAGSVLTIPAFDGTSIARVAEPATPSSIETNAAETTAYSGVAETTPSVSTTETVVELQQTEVAAPPSAPAVEVPVDVETLVSPEPAPVEPVVAADPIAQAPVEPAQTEAAPAQGDEAESSRMTLYWLAGTGFVLILMLLVFGRRMRRATPPPPAFDDSSAEEPIVEDQQVAEETEVDFDIGEQPSTEYAVALDADLSAGTGLSDGGEMEVAQDFGFSAKHEAAGELDMTLSDDTTIEEKPSTDVLPAHRAEATILEKEILPSDDDDDYDMSVIVDATKQRFGDGDITAKDLMAVAIAESSDDEDDDEYTLSREVDYKILEQDYEDELTATQALNAEIEKAAKDLANRLDEDDAPSADSTVETLAITAETTAIEAGEPEIITDLDDTGINEELTAEMPSRGVSSVADATSELPKPDEDECTDDTAANTEITEKLPAAENDPTAEMDVESGHFRTGQSRS